MKMIEGIHNNPLRNGNFTSSEIVALTVKGTGSKVFGPKALTYISECNVERRLGRSISEDSNARPLVWGKFLESRVFNLLGLEYTLSSQETDLHPIYNCWSGSSDGTTEDTVIDIKCPKTLASFCRLVQPLYDGLNGMAAMNAIRNGYIASDGMEHEKHKDGEKFYWQLVSNSILSNKQFAELIVYVPYQSELEAIREETGQVDGALQNKLAWINWAQDSELPYLNDGGFYKNLNIIRFEVPVADKEFLTSRVAMAQTKLISNHELIIS